MVKKVFYILFFSLFFFPELYPQWQWQNPLPQGNDLEQVLFIDDNYGWMLTKAGTLMRTTDGGSNWNEEIIGKLWSQKIYFIDRFNGWCVGSGAPPFIMRTIDGGTNWESNYLQSSSLNDVVFVDDSSGWVVGDHGFLWYTEDSGVTWEQVESGTNTDLNRLVFMENGEAGYIFGDNNTLLRYDKTTDVEVDNAVAPLMFKLYQNYPNPFNPETVIVYELRGTVFVNLKVYDLTGKEVMTLVNKNQTGGSYQVVWNGRNKYSKGVSTGIYFYRLKTDDFSQTRKMILIR